MPISVSMAFNNTGAPYNLSAVITNNTFDQAKYGQYSPMFLLITYTFTYDTIFVTYPTVVVHTYLWYCKDIACRFRCSLGDKADIHAQLMAVMIHPNFSHPCQAPSSSPYPCLSDHYC